MKNKFKIHYYLLFLLLLPLLNSCKKDLSSSLPQPGKSTDRPKGVNTLTPYPFDWESGDYMPTPNGTQILKPWASGSNQSFPLLYATDIKKADGWELVYNTFKPTEFVQPAYFVLYNRYRGILRGYFYLTPGTPIPSSYISHTLIQRTNGSDAPLLSYSGNSAADLSVIASNTNLVQQYKTTATGTWYAAEFEMAYDPSVGTKDANSNTMTWQVNSINASDLAINGTSQGSINGTIAQPNPPGPSIFGSVISGALDFVGLKALSSITLKATTPKIASDVIGSLKDAAKAGLTGQAKNIANGIFGGTSSGGDSTKQYVHLTTNTNYKLTGTSTDIYTLANPSMVIPGSNGQTSVSGYAPAYTKALGIMTLSAAPTSQLYEYDYSWGYTFGMTLNTNSYTIVWNPGIINSNPDGAVIRNLKQEIISYENYNDPYSNPGESSIPWPANITEYDGFNPYLKNDLAVDNIIRLKLYNTCYGCDFSNDALNYPLTDGKKLPMHVLRITFDVVPNNGTPKVTIVKSFNIILKGPTIYR
ncbi:hypothetical protein [Mucilaginibacter sp. 22184]|uniref:hypothetical protein n=1 Tax=Mucilaginibacter sp. 22184 TaxID=3453887 RepID=UPI003F83AEC6